ncbi:hypothetical protein F442_14974 [Phytophthora nicotianae P10297]|uniref:CCHC-type domain-containing protein n=1 Tax=Phytophthora nicotianae P10297 TaxID=1317064 RepID=W2YSS3_PHYNI|nr:hypothetical protein F442_14974 [Phytophthora nicotianae P10297]
MKAVLNARMVTSIPKACALLLYKNLHLPVEEEDEFAGEETGQPRTNGAASTESQVLQELRQMNQLMRTRPLGPGTPRGQVSAVVPPTSPRDGVPVANRNASGSALGSLRICLGPDTRTIEDEVVCRRCGRIGCSRETCPRRQGRCNRCNELGHYSVECNRPRTQRNYRNGKCRRMECFLCGEGDHTVAKCPSLERLRGAVRNATTGTPTGASQLEEGGRSVTPSSCLTGDTKGAEGSPRTTGEVKEALVKRGKNYEGARGVPVASVRTETVDIETGPNEKGSPTERTGSERDEEISGSTEMPKRERVGTAEATERHDVTPSWEKGTTERPRRVQDAATERSESASKPQGEHKEREKAVDKTVSSEQRKGALELTPGDAA